jgi:uncharacterized protein
VLFPTLTTAIRRDFAGTILPAAVALIYPLALAALHLADGDSVYLPAVSIYRMQDGKIIESRMYHFDTVALIRFLGRAGAEPTDSRGTSEISR